MIKLKQLLTEKTVRLSTMKDANFEPGQFVQLMGKKGMVKLDKKRVHSLAKIIRQMMGEKGMGWSFTMGEGKLNERSLKNDGPRLKVGQRIKWYRYNGKVTDVFVKLGQIYYHIQYDSGLSIPSAAKFVHPEHLALKGNKSHPKSPVIDEGKLTEGSKVVRLPNGVKVKIDFKGLTFIGGTKPVFLDRREMEIFFKATAKYLK